MQTNKQRTALLMAAAALGGMVVGQALPAGAQGLGGLLKGAGIAVIVDQFGGQIDRFVNQLTGNKPGPGESTRVVPIVTVGRGTYVGAVQISGPKENVDRVKAVAQVEGQTKIGNELRVKGLIPVNTTKPNDLTSISRIKGVGVSAIIDYRL